MDQFEGAAEIRHALGRIELLLSKILPEIKMLRIAAYGEPRGLAISEESEREIAKLLAEAG